MERGQNGGARLPVRESSYRAQIVPIRRCNQACTYCNEYDKHSPPVALATMRERIDHLARLRTANIEISGGEPLLHPDLVAGFPAAEMAFPRRFLTATWTTPRTCRPQRSTAHCRHVSAAEIEAEALSVLFIGGRREYSSTVSGSRCRSCGSLIVRAGRRR